MSKSTQEFRESLNFQTVIENLENGHYLQPELNSTFKNEVTSKIEEFSHWFNSTARLYLLKCDPVESGIYVYLLLNLKKKLQLAISEVSKSVSNRCQSYICNVCDEQIEIRPWQNVWDTLQDHPHFEENYSKIIDKTPSIVVESLQSDESSINDSVEDLSEESSEIVLPEEENHDKSPEESPDSFKFNLEVTYDERIEKTLYPETLVIAAHKADNLPDYTVQRHAFDQGVCLLCPCSLIAKGKISKFTPFVIKSHAYGHKHLRCASITANRSALTKYHEFWRSKEAIYQAHQVYFIPEITDVQLCKCRLCQQSVPYDNVIEHIKTDKLHKTRVWKICQSSKEKLNEFSLFDMQVEMYDTPKKEKKRIKENKALEKCDFIKFVIKPNEMNLQPRYKDHLQFFTKNSDLVSCKICKISFCNSSTVIRRHILSAQHTQLSGIPPQKYTFFCDICKTRLKDEDGWDDHFVKGPNKHGSIPQRRRFKVAEYECSTCKFVIYGDQSSLKRHISSRWSKEVKSSSTEQEGTNLQKETNKQHKTIDEIITELHQLMFTKRFNNEQGGSRKAFSDLSSDTTTSVDKSDSEPDSEQEANSWNDEGTLNDLSLEEYFNYWNEEGILNDPDLEDLFFL